MPEINQCTLTGRIQHIGKVQHSPAGILRCRLQLEHRSRQLENHHPVAVSCLVGIQLVGNHWSDLLQRLQPGQAVKVTGFLTAKGHSPTDREQLQLQASQLEVT